MILGFVLAFIYCIMVFPIECNNKPKIDITLYPLLHNGMVIIPYNSKNALHIHHWICYIPLLFLLNKSFVWFFFLGLIIQGLTYDDRFDIICRNPY